MARALYFGFLVAIVVGMGWGIPAAYKAGYRYKTTGYECHYASFRTGLTERPNNGECPLIARRG